MLHCDIGILALCIGSDVFDVADVSSMHKIIRARFLQPQIYPVTFLGALKSGPKYGAKPVIFGALCHWGWYISDGIHFRRYKRPWRRSSG